MPTADPAAGLIRRTYDMTQVLAAVLDHAEVAGDHASHLRIAHPLAALRDALVEDVFPTVLELDRDTQLALLRPAVLSAMQRRGLLRPDDQWQTVEAICDAALRQRATPPEMEEAAERLVLVEARARRWIAERLEIGLTG